MQIFEKILKNFQNLLKPRFAIFVLKKLYNFFRFLKSYISTKEKFFCKVSSFFNKNLKKRGKKK